MKSELDALIAKYEDEAEDIRVSSAGNIQDALDCARIKVFITDLKALRDKCDKPKTKLTMSVYP